MAATGEALVCSSQSKHRFPHLCLAKTRLVPPPPDDDTVQPRQKEENFRVQMKLSRLIMFMSQGYTGPLLAVVLAEWLDGSCFPRLCLTRAGALQTKALPCSIQHPMA